MAILLVHNLEHFIFPVYPESSPEWLTILDAGVFNATFSLFAGKSYAIFALLFGFTFLYPIAQPAVERKRLRLPFLAENGIACRLCYSQCCLFSGRRCVASVRCGRHRTVYRTQMEDKAILITAIFFSLQPIEWFHYIMSLFNPAYTLPDLNVGAMYAEVAAYTKGGNFWEFLIGNVTLGQKASLFWAIGAGRFFTDCRTFPIRLVHRTQTVIRHHRISFEILGKSAHHCCYQLRTSLLFERANHAE